MSHTQAISPRQVNLFDLLFWAVDLDTAAEIVMQAIQDGRKVFIVTPNVDHLVFLDEDRDARRIFQNSDFIFVDGMPIVWFSRLLPKPMRLPARVNGTNLMVQLCKAASKRNYAVGLIGGLPGAAEAASRELQTLFPGLRIAGHYCPPYGFERDAIENQKILTLIEEWQPDILFVGVGAPKQEKWAAQNWQQINVRAAIGVGSAIDYIGGLRRRAPVWMQNSGLEWVWRLLSDPGRLWKRYLVHDFRFLPLAWREYWKIRRQKTASPVSPAG